MMVWDGLRGYGFESDARRLAYRWLYTIARNAADYGGTVPEKFDLVLRSHRVFAEYGSVGTDFSYITREGFGWTNASVQCGRALLTDTLRQKLNALVPPEWITTW
jgi:alpha,alpha-trehalase